MLESTSLRPPRLRVEFPNYPVHIQLCRVYGGTLGSSRSASSSSGGSSGPNVYGAYVQQWNPGPVLRDREACYVWEPNGARLGAGYYLCRLDGVYPAEDAASLPLFATVALAGSGTISGNTLTTGAVLSGLSAAQAAAIIANLTSSQIFNLNNLNACQLQTFLALTTLQQQTLTTNLTATQLTNLVDSLTVTQLTSLVTTLTTGQLVTLTNTLTAEQVQQVVTVLTSSQVQTLVVNLTSTQFQNLVQYPPLVIQQTVTNLTTVQLQTLLNLTNRPFNPLINTVGQTTAANTAPVQQLLVSTLTVAGPPTWTPTTGTYPWVFSIVDGFPYQWDGSVWQPLANLTVGKPVGGGTASDVLFVGPTGLFAQSPQLQFVVNAGLTVKDAVNTTKICDGTYGVNAAPFNVNAGGYYVNGTPGASGNFTTVDLKTVTVANGIITSIV